MNFAERYGAWALIAGASEGVGAAFARAIAGKGVSLILVARREAPLEALAQEIRAAHGVECVTAAIDLSAPDAPERLKAAAAGREVGLYVANAGSDPNAVPFLDRDVEAWRGLVQMNVGTTMEACHHFGAAMLERGRGGLLLVNSGAAYGGISAITTYCASKAFVLNFAEGLWAELKDDGVDVLTLVLGPTNTPALHALIGERGVPPPRRLAEPEDVAATGLERLGSGPVCNFGQDDDEVGQAVVSASARRERAEKFSRGSPFAKAYARRTVS